KLGDPPVNANGKPEGPKLGNMKTWGTDVTGPGWNFDQDPGLIRLRRNSSWNLSTNMVSQTLSAKGYGTYNSAEISAINSSSYDNDAAAYRRRVLVALGIYRWRSGKNNGQSGGNG